MQETWALSLGGEEGGEKMTTHSSLLARKSHGQRSLAGCSPGGRTEVDMTAWLTLPHSSLEGLSLCLPQTWNPGPTQPLGLPLRAP